MKIILSEIAQRTADKYQRMYRAKNQPVRRADLGAGRISSYKHGVEIFQGHKARDNRN